MVVRLNTTNTDYTYKPVLYNKCFQKREIPIYTSRSQLTTDAVVLSNNTPKNQKYKLGKINNDYRIIDTDSITISFNDSSTADYDQLCSKEEKFEFEKNLKIENGEFNNFRQGTRGDCFLLSSIYSINQTKNGW